MLDGCQCELGWGRWPQPMAETPSPPLPAPQHPVLLLTGSHLCFTLISEKFWVYLKTLQLTLGRAQIHPEVKLILELELLFSGKGGLTPHL